MVGFQWFLVCILFDWLDLENAACMYEFFNSKQLCPLTGILWEEEVIFSEYVLDILAILMYNTEK